MSKRIKKIDKSLITPNLNLPVIPLKNVVVFPNMVMPLFVGRQRSVTALNISNNNDSYVVLITQKNEQDAKVTANDLYEVGTVAKVLQLLKLPDGTHKVLIEGKSRAQINSISEQENHLSANVTIMNTHHDLTEIEAEAIKREVLQQFAEFCDLYQKLPDELINLINKIDNIEQLIDIIITHISSDVVLKQEVLETTSLKKRADKLLKQLLNEIQILTIEKKIQGRVKRQIEKNQKEYYLHEQAKAIQQELGEEELTDIEELEREISLAELPPEVHKKVQSELKKLKQMPVMSSESSVMRNYIDHLISLPWNKSTKLKNTNLADARAILDHDHYGLEKVKERIIEFIAVQQRKDSKKGLILCLVGPPGVGKTSLGESIAKTVGRKFVRMALGGVRDEAEIRGHRRTYIGAQPGRIIQYILRTKVKNPLFLLDEIDKIGADHRGDPAAALLEVLDPEQNKEFVDHYTELGFDLSEVLFIATANKLDIPEALRDRMEIVRLPGYTEQEKLSIANNYLIPKQIKHNGLKNGELIIEDDVVLDIIRHYTSEAGVRNLEREINKICRKSVTTLDSKKSKNKTPIKVSKKNLKKFLGVKIYDFGVAAKKNRIGRITGLAWTEFGGEILTIEAVDMPGKGQIIRTGRLGDVMLESIQTAISLVRSRATTLGIDNAFYETRDIHVHLPEGAVPKDGPSAGVAMSLVIASSLSKIPIKSYIAITGEVTLYGNVLPIGGLKEKLIAALRANIRTVIIPKKNVKDLEEIPNEIKESLEIIPIETIDEAFNIAFEYPPTKNTASVTKNVQHTLEPVVI